MARLGPGVTGIPSSDEDGRNPITVKRNLGLRASNEDLVAFLDDDDLWHPRKLRAQVAAMGDDLPDLPLLRAAGFAATVPDAPVEVRGAADLVTQRRGGEGAVREVIEHILKAQGRWADIVSRFDR